MIGLLLGVSAGLVLWMVAGWIFQRAAGNGGWTDVFWTFGTGLAGAAAALFPLTSSPPSPRQLLVAFLAAAWALRLGLHMTLRVARSPEDARYAELRTRWGEGFQLMMARFLPIQAIASIPLLASIMLAARNPTPGLAVTDILGAGVLVLAVLGEGVADRQLERFKARPESAGLICDVGLWRWSRHPNYFFEWLGWLAYPVIALGPDGGWASGALAMVGPIAMFVILNFGTGLPPLEAHMLRTRGGAFRDYKRRTSAFFPLPPRPEGSA